MRVKRKKPQSAAFFIGQMDGNSIALDNTANDGRRDANKMTKLQVGCNLAGQIKEELKPVSFSLQDALRAFERVKVERVLYTGCISRSLLDLVPRAILNDVTSAAVDAANVFLSAQVLIALINPRLNSYVR